MKHLFITLMFCAAFVSETFATVWYVKTTGSDANAGTSWNTAFQNVQKAINSALVNDEIWVAEGTYLPTTAIGGATNRYKTFYIGINVKLYGSFAGNETSIDQRIPYEHPTILSGDLGIAGDHTDNAYHVVWIEKVGLDMWLDGFTVTGGNANGTADVDRSGGGIYNNGAAGISSPTIAGCTISGNNAYHRGGGLYNNGTKNGDVRPKLSVCIFEGNTAGLEGAGLCNDGRDKGSASPQVFGCTFSGNISNLRGGGVINTVSPGGNASGFFADCVFTDNSAAEHGGGMANFVDLGGISSPELLSCTFSNNVAGSGGGVASLVIVNGTSYPRITNCTFVDNQAVRGAGMYNAASLSGVCGLTLEKCTFMGNHAVHGGGIYHYSPQSLNLQDHCYFENNSAEQGGAIYVRVGAIDASGVYFTGNNTSRNGGAITFEIYETTSSSVFTTCKFENNSTVEKGGALYFYSDPVSFANTITITFNECKFSDNSASNGGAIATKIGSNLTNLHLRLYNALFFNNNATERGGAFCAYENKGAGAQKLYNCTFYNNTATLGGGVVGTADFVNGQGAPSLINSIAWGNSSTFGQTAGGQGGLNIQFSLIQESTCPTGATCSDSHYNEDPLFSDPASEDFHLEGCSPGIDAGTSAGAPAIDYDYNARPVGGVIELGAYEYNGAPILPKAICKNITVELNAAGSVSIPASSINEESTGCSVLVFKINNQASQTYNCSQLGARTVTLQVSDHKNNTSTCAATITVRDATAPTMLCKPVTINLNAAGQATLAVAQVDNGSYDNCGITFKGISQTLFTCANVGANSVILGGGDAGNNKGQCTAIVTVKDLIFPVAKCKNITANLEANGLLTLAPALVDNGSTDNCGLTLTVTPAAFNCGTLGANPVTLRATDASGNFSTCAATIIVKDVTAPNALCKHATIFLDDLGNATLGVNAINNGSTDACGIATMTLSKAQFNCSEVSGPLQNVTLTLKDVNNNSSFCTAQVTVKDNMAPTAYCEDVTVQLDATGKATVYSSVLADDSYDNCSIWSFTPTAKVYNTTNIGYNNLTIYIKDGSNNTATCVSVVTVQPFSGLRGTSGDREVALETDLSHDFGLSVYPNPTAGDARVDFELAAAQQITLRVLDLTGRIVINQQLEGTAGSNKIRLEMGAMSNGVYVVEIQAGNFHGQKRLMVQAD